ncbi:unnamed protein product [Toxocara canis]|uniref:Uncharacterized protein n=1 Tax=Toxocara canis TaxID=6265 RepID=A0A183UHF3_TOXCA|nr:unnamed protein product [Toxocara canis]
MNLLSSYLRGCAKDCEGSRDVRVSASVERLIDTRSTLGIQDAASGVHSGMSCVARSHNTDAAQQSS